MVMQMHLENSAAAAFGGLSGRFSLARRRKRAWKRRLTACLVCLGRREAMRSLFQELKAKAGGLKDLKKDLKGVKASLFW